VSGNQPSCGICGEPMRGMRLLCCGDGGAYGWIHSSPVCAAVSVDRGYPQEPYTCQEMAAFADELGYDLPNAETDQ